MIDDQNAAKAQGPLCAAGYGHYTPNAAKGEKG
jgi:hypothetical protein